MAKNNKKGASLSGFYISLIVFMLFFVGGIGLFMASINANYPQSDYNASKIEAYNKLSDIATNTEQIENATLGLASNSKVDILGGFVTASYGVLKLLFSSFGLFNEMWNTASSDIHLEGSAIIFGGLLSIVLIILAVVIIDNVNKGKGA